MGSRTAPRTTNSLNHQSSIVGIGREDGGRPGELLLLNYSDHHNDPFGFVFTIIDILN